VCGNRNYFLTNLGPLRRIDHQEQWICPQEEPMKNRATATLIAAALIGSLWGSRVMAEAEHGHEPAHAVPAAHEEHAAPAAHEEHAAPAAHEEHAAPAAHGEHAAPAHHDEHAAPAHHEEHPAEKPGAEHGAEHHAPAEHASPAPSAHPAPSGEPGPAPSSEPSPAGSPSPEPSPVGSPEPSPEPSPVGEAACLKSTDMVALLGNKNVVSVMVKMALRHGAKLTAIEQLPDEGQLGHYRFTWQKPGGGGAAGSSCSYEFLLHHNRGASNPKLLLIRAPRAGH
jgi:hypothetical protein